MSAQPTDGDRERVRALEAVADRLARDHRHPGSTGAVDVRIYDNSRVPLYGMPGCFKVRKGH